MESAPQGSSRRRPSGVVIAVVVAAVAMVLGLFALAGFAVFGVERLRATATPTPSASLPSPSSPEGSVSVPSPDPTVAGESIPCSPSTPASVGLVSGVLAAPAHKLAESRSWSSGGYEVFVAMVVDEKDRGLAPAMWVIVDGTAYAASSAATTYSNGIEDLTYEVDQGLRAGTGRDLQQIADALDLPCPTG